MRARPGRVWAQPEDVAALGVFLASDECRFMTGANVLIDGGFMAY